MLVWTPYSKLKSLQLEIEENKRQERFLRHKIDDGYNWLESRRDADELRKRLKMILLVYSRFFREIFLFYLNRDMFKAQSPARQIFDSVAPETRFKRWGPLTMFKPMAPNLLPVPLFIAGSLSSRALVTSNDVDLAGGSFMVDSSFLWIDSLA